MGRTLCLLSLTIILAGCATPSVAPPVDSHPFAKIPVELTTCQAEPSVPDADVCFEDPETKATQCRISDVAQAVWTAALIGAGCDCRSKVAQTNALRLGLPPVKSICSTDGIRPIIKQAVR